MYAVEFETVVNDSTIYIPAKHKEFDSQNVKVILMIATAPKNVESRKPGTAKGLFSMTDDFADPLDEEIIELFYS